MHLLTRLLASCLLVAGVAYAASTYRFESLAGGRDTDLRVWSSSAPAGKTWEQLGPKGGAVVVPPEKGKEELAGLTLRMTATGYRSCGLNWKGWFPADAGDDCRGYASLRFKIRLVRNLAPNPDLTVRLVDNTTTDNRQSSTVSLVAGGWVDKLDATWREATVPLAAFADNKPLKLDRLWEIVFANDDIGEQIFQIDEIGFTKQAAKQATVEKKTTDREVTSKYSPEPAPAPALAFPARAKRTTANEHAISPGIYGVADMPADRRERYAIPSRFGGNHTSRHNWRINADNGAADWFFKNRLNALGDASTNAWTRTLIDNQSINAASYICVPTLGWVAKDDNSHGYSVSKYGAQRKTEDRRPDVGDGTRSTGEWITGNNPMDSSTISSPADIGEGIRKAVDKANRLAKQGLASPTRFWVLDNEPMLWHETHRDVHPNPVGYDELWKRTVEYAEAIRAADPKGNIAGLCSWGWQDLFHSAKDKGYDEYQTHLDKRSHGDVPLAEWFLMQCAEYERKYGLKLIDVLDVHWYPQADAGGKTPYDGKGAQLNELRLRSTRDLWDPHYANEGWPRNSGDRKPVALIPRMKQLIEKHCPGMQLALGEYNFGGGENVTGGLAQAEIFGIFAREKLDLAFFWQQPDGSQWAAWELFRNYDGKGGRFGDRYLPVECDHPKCAVFAARRESDGAITLVAINKSLSSPCKLEVELPGAKGRARLWRFDAGNLSRVSEVKESLPPVDGRTTLTLPAGSATIIVVK